MNRNDLVKRVRIITRDLTESIFRENDIVDFINEGIERFAQVIPEMESIKTLSTATSNVTLIPRAYQHLLAVYAASRCFAQDERHYQATTLMNEFDVKVDELKQKIENGAITIIGEDGLPITASNPIDYVDLRPYWNVRSIDEDEGV